PLPPSPPLFPYTTLFRSTPAPSILASTQMTSPLRLLRAVDRRSAAHCQRPKLIPKTAAAIGPTGHAGQDCWPTRAMMIAATSPRSEEHTSELQSLRHLVC